MLHMVIRVLIPCSIDGRPKLISAVGSISPAAPPAHTQSPSPTSWKTIEKMRGGIRFSGIVSNFNNVCTQATMFVHNDCTYVPTGRSVWCHRMMTWRGVKIFGLTHTGEWVSRWRKGRKEWRDEDNGGMRGMEDERNGGIKGMDG